MKNLIAINYLIFSGLSIHSQNLITTQVLINTSNPSNNQQIIQGNAENNIEVQINTSSARNIFGNTRGNRGAITQTKNKIPQTVKQTNKQPVNNLNYEVNDNVSSNDNIQVNTQVIIQSNPLQVNNAKVDHVEKKVDVPVGIDFTPSGLSGRDYSNGGKLKKGEKNFYTQSNRRPVSRVKKHRFKGNKKSYSTHSCAKWKA